MSKAHNLTNISITTGTFVRGLLVLLGAWLVYFLFDLVLVILSSVVIASAVEPATRWFMKYRVPRVLGVLAVYFLAFVVIFGFLYLLAPPLFLETRSLIEGLPDQVEDLPLVEVVEGLGPLSGFVGVDTTIAEFFSELRHGVEKFSTGALATATTLFGGLFSFVLILVISFYLAVQQRGIERFLSLVTPVSQEDYVIDLWHRSQVKIGQWMKGQLVLGLIVGVMVFLTLTLFQVPHALLLAVLAAFMELIPVFGPIIAAVPAVIIGFTQSVTTGLIVIAIYVVIQQFENHLIYPLVVKKIVGVPPIIVIISLIIGAQLAGFLGILLSVPVATVLRELANDYQARKLSFQQKKVPPDHETEVPKGD